MEWGETPPWKISFLERATVPVCLTEVRRILTENSILTTVSTLRLKIMLWINTMVPQPLIKTRLSQFAMDGLNFRKSRIKNTRPLRKTKQPRRPRIWRTWKQNSTSLSWKRRRDIKQKLSINLPLIKWPRRNSNLSIFNQSRKLRTRKSFFRTKNSPGFSNLRLFWRLKKCRASCRSNRTT